MKMSAASSSTRLLHGDVDLAILFSFTRSYFEWRLNVPIGLVRYLQQLMPRKRLIDLYNAIGFHRHGKTEFYRDFIAHLRKSTDCFVWRTELAEW